MSEFTYIGFVRAARHQHRERQFHSIASFRPVEIIEQDVETAIARMRPGTALVVRQVSVLSRNVVELKRICRTIHQRGGFVFESLTGRSTRLFFDAFEMGLDANRRRPLVSARRPPRASHRLHSSEDIEKWRTHWHDPWLTGEAVAERSGISQSTLRKHFGKRGIRPGRPPARRQ